MDKFTLPTSVVLGDNVEIEINSDFRDILKIFSVLNDEDLTEPERIIVSLQLFYRTSAYREYIEEATQKMFEFMTIGEVENKQPTHSKPLYDWEQDFDLIVAPVNRVIGKDIRGVEYLHWWTFLSAFMEIGECTFNTFVGIRNKLNKGKKLEKYEKDILKENRDRIILKKKYDSTTQELMNEIMGV